MFEETGQNGGGIADMMKRIVTKGTASMDIVPGSGKESMPAGKSTTTSPMNILGKLKQKYMPPGPEKEATTPSRVASLFNRDAPKANSTGSEVADAATKKPSLWDRVANASKKMVTDGIDNLKNDGGKAKAADAGTNIAGATAPAKGAPVAATAPAKGAPVAATAPAKGAPVAAAAPAKGAPGAAAAPAKGAPGAATAPAKGAPGAAAAPAKGAPGAAGKAPAVATKAGVGLPGKSSLIDKLGAGAKLASGFLGKLKGAKTKPDAKGKSKRNNMAKCLEKLVSAVIMVIGWVLAVLQFMPTLWLIIWALVAIGVVLLIVVTILYMLWNLYPRVCLLNHSEDMDSYTVDLCSTLHDQLRALGNEDLAWMSELGAADVGGFKADIERLLARRGLKEDLKTYFWFKMSFTNLNCIGRSDIRNNLPDFVSKDGDGAKLDTQDFREGVCKPMRHIQEALEGLSSSMLNGGDFRKRFNLRGSQIYKRARDALAVHTARMIMEQQPAIELMAMTRRKFFALGIWLVYYIPLVKTIYVKRIPSVWRAYPIRSAAMLASGFDWWYRVGQSIALLPCNMAYSDPEKRADKCKTFFKESFVSAQAAKGVAKRDIVEGFGLTDLFGGVMSLVMAVVPLCMGIWDIMQSMATDPFKGMVSLVMVFVGMILALILIILHTLLSITMVAFGIIAIFSYVFTLYIAWWYTVLLVLLSLLMGITYALLWLIDMPTGGFVVRMMRCDQRPDGWYTQSGFAEGNGFSTFAPLCYRPCATRYRVVLAGTCCKRMRHFMPDWCPQQQIYRIFLHGGVVMTDIGPYAFVNYPNESGFRSRTQSSKASTLVSAYKEKVEWYQRCYRAYGEKDYLTRHLCDNIDVLASDSPFQAKAMRTVCREVFCDYVPDDNEEGIHAWRTDAGYQNNAPGGPNEQSCMRMLDADKRSEEKGGGPGGALLKRTIVIAAFTLVVLTSVYALIDIAPKVTSVLWDTPMPKYGQNVGKAVPFPIASTPPKQGMDVSDWSRLPPASDLTKAPLTLPEAQMTTTNAQQTKEDKKIEADKKTEAYNKKVSDEINAKFEADRAAKNEARIAGKADPTQKSDIKNAFGYFFKGNGHS